MPLDLPPLRTPVIADLVPSLDEEHAEVLAWLLTEYGWAITADASDPAWRLTRVLSYRTVLNRQTVADSVSQVSLEYAVGPMLDHIGVTYYRLPRNPGERDDAYRARIVDAPGLFAVGLTALWYESVALAIAGVSSAFVVGAAQPDEAAGTTPGAVTLALLSDGMEGDFPDGLPTAALLDTVLARITAADIRQQTDRVHVVPAYRVPYDVTVSLTLHPNVDAAAVRADAERNLLIVCRTTDVIGGRTDTALVAGATVNPAVVRTAAVTLEEVDPARADTTIDVGPGAAQLMIAALRTGADGEEVTIALVDPGANDRPLAIAILGTDITVTLATSDVGAITTTVADLVAAWPTSPGRRLALLTATGDTTTLLTAQASQALVLAPEVLTVRESLSAPPNAGLSCRRLTVTLV